MKTLSFVVLTSLMALNSLSVFAYDKGRSGSSRKLVFEATTTGTETSGGNATDNFAKFDANHDGYLARREWPGDTSIFSKLDKNHDGKLSRAEYTQST